jgi:diaminohydroxyphosphoribosylaminopyrimidine deaminase / 5-amino-6-(5-phosphoribosylamino)uracil reductase
VSSTAKRMLDLAARAAVRARGYVEPNPLVGCVITQPADGGVGERVIGIGHHRFFGGPHAEVDAIGACIAAQESTRGATAYVTLEPCAHFGKQPPCVDAIRSAGIARVVCARRDPNNVAAGGAEKLQAAGIVVEFTSASVEALALGGPFVKRATTGLPWVIAKWAQTIDGRVGTRAGESKWISNEQSRSQVHRLRARVDAIVTGIGTVLADDPALTARDGWKRRKTARRVVIDPDLETPDSSQILRTVSEAPVTIVVSDETLIGKAQDVSVLVGRGVEIVALGSGGEVDVAAVLRHLAEVHDASNVLIESGPGLLGRMLEADLVDQAMVFIAPILMGDDQARPAARGRVVERLDQALRLELWRVKRYGDDVMMDYRRV